MKRATLVVISLVAALAIPPAVLSQTPSHAPALVRAMSAPSTSAIPPTTSTTALVFRGLPPEASRSQAAPRPRVRRFVAPPPTAPVIVSSGGYPPMSRLLRRIGGCESSGRADGPLLWSKWNSRGSGANGAFQDMTSTWLGWQRTYAPQYHYPNAASAPPDVQVQVNQAALDHGGTGPWNSSAGCWRG